MVYLLVIHQLGITSNQWEAALRLSQACRLSCYDSEVESQFANEIYWNASHVKYGEWRGWGSESPLVDPTVDIVTPHPDQRTGPRPKLRIETTDGDFRQPQVDLGALRFTLDGQDLSSDMLVRSFVDTSLREDRVYERLRLTVRPRSDLAPGLHTVHVDVPTYGYRGTGPGFKAVGWTFVVARDCDGPQDGPSADD